MLPDVGISPGLASVLNVHAITKDDNWGRSARIRVLVLGAGIWAGIGTAAALFL